MAERKNPKLDAQHQAILKRMMQLPENKACADCKGPYPRWASTNLGIFICMTCSGIHRKLGTHLSQVRSITLDTWTVNQINHFQKLGNLKAHNYFEACLPNDFKRPHSSDSMRMEAFIRDKYERRKYITIENGGLGGADSNNNINNNNTLGMIRPTQPQQHALKNRFTTTNRSYDDVNTNKRPTSSTSYAARFSNNNSNNNSNTSVYSSTRSTVNNKKTSTSSSTIKNPVVRATTLKELVNMGFSTDVALRAVEASNGDLQKAVDWVIENTSNNNKQQKQNNNTKKSNTSIDLLDFDEPAPTQPQKKEQSSHISTIQTKKANHFDDFTDFGDFESALPSKPTATPTRKPNTTTATTTNNNTTNKPSINGSNLSSSLADLYKRPAPQVQKPTTNTQAQTTATTNNTKFEFPSKNFHSNKSLFSNKQQEKQSNASLFDGSKLGLPNIDVRSDFKSNKLNGNKVNNSEAFNFSSLPPPPPPMQESAILSTENDPPPPSPPKLNQPGSLRMSKQGKITLNKSNINSFNHEDHNTITEDTSNPIDQDDDDDDTDDEQQQVEQKKLEETKEDDDPFAALSMLALSSASKKN